MSTFPYVDISHKKIWRPLSTGRYVDPTLFFIYLFRGRLPSLLGPTAALCANGAGPAGTPPGRGPVSAGLGRRGAACVCAPFPPLFSPRLVTIRRNVVAGSMTPRAEAASPLS